MAVLLSAIITEAKELCHKANTDFATDAAWAVWINQGVRRIWNRIMLVNPEFLLSTSDFTLTGTTNTTTFPTGMRMLYGVERDPTLTTRHWLRPTTAMMKNAVGDEYRRRRNFRRTRTTIVIDPLEYAAGNYRTHYIGSPTDLVLAADTAIDSVIEPWWNIPAIFAAMRAMDKDEVARDQHANSLARAEEEMESELARANSALPVTMTDVDDLGVGWEVR